MEIKQPNWERDLTEFIQDDFDGRMWFDDMVERVLEFRMPSQAFDDYLRAGADEVDEDSFNAGVEVGYEDGYESGYNQWTDEQFITGYREGYNDGKIGKESEY